MGRIQSNTGLVTGIDISGTVDKLIALQAKPRDLLTARLNATKGKQTAVAELTATVIGVQLAARGLKADAVFSKISASSGDASLLTASASASGSAAPGTYQFTPIRQAQAQTVLSRGFASRASTVSAGTITLRDGGKLDSGINLSQLNGGEGVERGKIKITDRAGDSAVIDLRYVQTIDDVLEAINTNDSINVRAETQGDRIVLTDTSGATASNLRVQEVGSGTTAADLGLNAINAAANSATGRDILSLDSSLSLARLNDGNGLSFNESLADLSITFRDGSSPLEIDFHRTARAESHAELKLDSAGGVNADLTLTAVATGAAQDGYRLQFTNSGTTTAGSETVTLDTNAKTITVDLEGGVSTADQVIAALNANTSVSALFVASRGTGSNGTGIIATADTAVSSGGAAIPAGTESTLADLLTTINAADPTRLRAAISADGDRLELTDLTSNTGGTFGVTSLHGGTIAEDLGLTRTASGATLSGGRLQAGLKTTLLHSLGGGFGLGTLGEIEITDRSGDSEVINLAASETLDDVISAINGAGLGVKARINETGDGLSILDTTGATTSNLILSDHDGTNSATKLGIAASVAADRKVGGPLNRQIVNENTLLSDYNHGKGVKLGGFTITDSSGQSRGINLRTLQAETIGDVIKAVNDLPIGVTARINDTGDGIVLIDTAGGGGKLTVRDVGSGTAATGLKLAGVATTTSIDGSTTAKLVLDGTEKLSDVVTKINALGAGVSAGIVADSSALDPYKISVNASKTGRAGALLYNAGTTGLDWRETASARDSLAAVGAVGDRLGTLASSSTDVIEDVIPGLTITLKGTSNTPVNVVVTNDIASISSKVKLFVDQYNKLVDKVESVSFFRPEDNSKGVLYGSSEALRLTSDFSRIVSGRFVTGGSIQSLAEIGVTINQQGKLDFASTKLEDAYADNPEGVKSLFTHAERGFAKRIDDAAERLAGIKNSVLINRSAALQRQAELASSRIADWTLRLDSSKERLLKTFYSLENSVGKLQNSFGSIQSSLTNAANLSASVSR